MSLTRDSDMGNRLTFSRGQTVRRRDVPAFAVPTNLSSATKVLAGLGYQRLPYQMRSRLGQHPPNVRRNELVKFSKLVEQFFNEIKECALLSQRP